MSSIPEAIRHQSPTAAAAAASSSSKLLSGSSRPVVLADLNDNPPPDPDDDFDTVVTAAPDHSRLMNNDENSQERSGAAAAAAGNNDGDVDGGAGRRLMNKLGKPHTRNYSNNKAELPIDVVGMDVDGEQLGQGPPSRDREEKVSSLKTGLVHVARKMPKNAHANFILGLMYQRIGQPLKALVVYEKAVEILLKCDEEIDRPEFLSLVQLHRAQCILLGNIGDYGSDKDLGPEVVEETISKMKESVQRDIRQAAVWNTLGYILLKSNRLQNAISILKALLALVPDHLDCICNLGVAYLHSGNLELSEKCFQLLISKDQNHPAALINYAAVLLCKHGSIVAGPGASGEGSSTDQVVSANVAKECLLAAVKANPKAPHIWANLGNAYYIAGDYRSSSKCLEKAAKLDYSCMPIRYAVAILRIKEAERLQDPSEQISWAGNEMASILREGDPNMMEPAITWSGLAMVHKTQHEIATTYESGRVSNSLPEIAERASFCLKQALAENPDDAVQWHQLGLHSLCTQQFQASTKYLKAAVNRLKECSYAWSNLGVSLQLSKDPSQAEEVLKRALSLATPQQSHAIFSNLGVLYGQQKQYENAKAMFTKALELQPGYAPAYNNLGLVFVAEDRWEEAKYCFEKAFETDSFLDAAKSNFIKVASILGVSTRLSSCQIQD